MTAWNERLTGDMRNVPLTGGKDSCFSLYRLKYCKSVNTQKGRSGLSSLYPPLVSLWSELPKIINCGSCNGNGRIRLNRSPTNAKGDLKEALRKQMSDL